MKFLSLVNPTSKIFNTLNLIDSHKRKTMRNGSVRYQVKLMTKNF